jgi:hypothetical protein
MGRKRERIYQLFRGESGAGDGIRTHDSLLGSPKIAVSRHVVFCRQVLRCKEKRAKVEQRDMPRIGAIGRVRHQIVTKNRSPRDAAIVRGAAGKRGAYNGDVTR